MFAMPPETWKLRLRPEIEFVDGGSTASIWRANRESINCGRLVPRAHATRASYCSPRRRVKLRQSRGV